MRPVVLVASVFMGLIALAHLLRLLLRIPIVLGGQGIPVWLSLPAFLFTAGLTVLLVREWRRG